METNYIRIIGDFDARQVYNGLRFYSRDSSNSKEVNVKDFKADKKEYLWEEDTLEFLELGTARLFHSP